VKKLKILFVTPEAAPLAKTGGLADVSYSLPLSLIEKGHDVRIILPKYGAIDERKFKIHEVLRLKNLVAKIGDKEARYNIRTSFVVGNKYKVQAYLVENHEYFSNRKGLYSDPITGKDYEDNNERFILFARSVIEAVKLLGWQPDIIHLNDWQSSLVPLYLKLEKEESLKNSKTLLTIHNLAYQGEFPLEEFYKLGLPESYKFEDGVVIYDKINFLKTGILYADAINTVSPTYAKEIIEDKERSAGLKKVLLKRKDCLYGILNGIDEETWNPEKDEIILRNYNYKSYELKLENKKNLAVKFGFDFNPDEPYIYKISRIIDAKGFDLISEIFDELMKLDIKLFLLGVGEKKYHKFFIEKQNKYKNKFGCYIGYNEDLSHYLHAGGDIFLMPSRYEPCGLNQMYALKYGAVPIVRKTGGLNDTIIDIEEDPENGYGFSFKEYKPETLLKSIIKAVDLYKNNKALWLKIIKRGMKKDFSWNNSAKLYIDLYKNIISK